MTMRNPAYRGWRWILAAGALAVSASALAGVLYEQPPAATGRLVNAAWWEPDGTDYDTWAWDNFILPAGGTITELHWIGGHDPAYWPYSTPVINFEVAIYANSIANEPDVVQPPLVHYSTHGNAGESPAGTFAGMPSNHYQFVLPEPFQAAPGVQYWVYILAWQHGIPDWALAPGSGGDGSFFREIHGVGGGHIFQWIDGDAAFWLTDDITIDSADHRVAYQGWAGIADPLASAGSHRASDVAGGKATFPFKGATLAWTALAGPDRGIAHVSIDGVARPDVDLYRATAARRTTSYAQLGSGAHTIAIEVSGTANPQSSGTSISIDAFKTSAATVQDTSVAIQYGSWNGKASASALKGDYRGSRTRGASAALTFTGTHVDWITAKCPACGQAEVFIDGTSRGIVDLYAPAAQWQTSVSFDGLAPGSHRLRIKVLPTRNPASSGGKVIVDAFTVGG